VWGEFTFRTSIRHTASGNLPLCPRQAVLYSAIPGSCHLSGFYPESAGLDMSPPDSGLDHYFSGSPVTPQGQFLFYLTFYLRIFEVRDICWRFIELLKFYSVIWQHCTLQTWCDIKYNTVLCWAKLLSIPFSNACREDFFRSLAIPGPTEETAWEWNLSNQNCAQNLILTWHVRILLIF
jgi:hypothetical protein